jgi:hypothetical protein
MCNLRIDDDDEIQRFADPQYWILYFLHHVKRDLEMMGLKVNLSHLYFRIEYFYY